jgi:hypothetical protein
LKGGASAGKKQWIGKEMNGNVEYHKTGEYVSVSKDNDQTFDQGHGVLTRTT